MSPIWYALYWICVRIESLNPMNSFFRSGWLSALLEFFMPRYCKVCGRRLEPHEEHLCMACFAAMPRLEYCMDGINLAERMLIARKSLGRAASVLQYDKESNYRMILFHLKYWDHPDVGIWLAKIGARYLDGLGFFEGIDCIVPVPLSRKKRRRRGYNQCEYIASGVSQVTGLPILTHALEYGTVRTHQAGLGQYQRWSNAQGLFSVSQPEQLQGKKILIVDDVVTTGATLNALIDAIEQAVPEIEVSVFTLALASL